MALVRMIGMMFKPGIRQTHPHVAALRAFMLSQLPITVALDMTVLGLIPAPPFLRGILYMGAGSKALRGFSSDITSLALLPFLYLPLLLSGGHFDDEEDIQKTVTHFLRKTWWGFVPMYAFDTIVTMMLMIGGSIEDALETVIDATEVFRGGRLLPNPLKIYKEVIEPITN